MANTQRFFAEIDVREQQRNTTDTINYHTTEETATTQISSGQHSTPSSIREMNIPTNSANSESAQVSNTSRSPGFGPIHPASTHDRLNMSKNTEYNSSVLSNVPPSNGTSISSAYITVMFLNRVGQIPAANYMGEESFVTTDVDDPQVQETLREASNQRDTSSWAVPRRSARIAQREEIIGNTNTSDDNQSMEISNPEEK